MLSYYLGLFAILPVLGIGLGIAALIQGNKGVKFQKEHPEASGKAHAGIGIGCGAFGLLFNLFLVAIILLAVFGSKNKEP